jgi:acyl-CoA thioesterase
MTVKTLHTVFARAARPDVPLDIAVDRMHAGRTFASTTITIGQDGRICTRAMALLSADEPDFIRHADPPGHLTSPDDAAPGPSHGEGLAWEVRIVDGVDVNDPDATGPADLDAWSRFVGVSEDPVVGQALLAYATDGFLIGAAMRPHVGVGQAQAHQSVATGVISHTLTFHEPCTATEWLLLAHHSPYAGHGRSYGRADVFRENGDLVASFVQDSMIRAM